MMEKTVTFIRLFDSKSYFLYAKNYFMSPFFILLVIIGIVLFIFIIKGIVAFFAGSKPGKTSNIQFSKGDSVKTERNTGITDDSEKKAGKRKDEIAEANRKRFNETAEANRKRAADAFEATRKRNEIIRKQTEDRIKAARDRNEMQRKQLEDLNRIRRNQRGF